MTIKKIMDYILYTPYNINKMILAQMLKELILEHGGTLQPDAPIPPEQNTVVYDGGLEV